jgi:ActR/RegA family two-component response regulator
MIIVVDDDVGFAEELQDLLFLHGFLAVVVVTHPHASNLVLLRSARLLILDLSLALTTALGVLNDLGEPGKAPAVVLVSGSGAEALEKTRLAAIARGFRVLGALPKPVAPEVLLGLIATFKHPLAPGTEEATSAWNDSEPVVIHPMQVVATGSLTYQGKFLRLDNSLAPGTIAPQAVAAQRSLSLRGLDGFVVVTPLHYSMRSPEALERICASADHIRQMSGKIVFDLGPSADERKWWAEALNTAGFGVMVRISTVREMEEVGTQLPVKIIAVRADLAEQMIQSDDSSAAIEMIARLAARSIRSLTTDVRSMSDLRVAVSLGIGMLTTFSSNS